MSSYLVEAIFWPLEALQFTPVILDMHECLAVSQPSTSFCLDQFVQRQIRVEPLASRCISESKILPFKISR